MQRRTFLKAFALSASVVAMGVSFSVQAADTLRLALCIRYPARWPYPKRR